MSEIQALLIDDEEQCVRSLKKSVDWNQLGISKTIGVFSADEARKALQENDIQLILCDIEMPGESGLEFIQWVREDADLNGVNLECIILTCYPDYKFMRKAMQMGCSDYLIKPVDYDELKEVLKKAVAKIEESFKQTLSEEQEDNFGYDDIEKQNIVHIKVIPYIEQHFTEALTVTEIASDAALNSQYLMRLFKKTTGESVLEYVTNCRMEYAKKLLKKTEWNNEIISEKVGYASSNYFIKLFKKQYGVTPREYRKKSLLDS